MCGCVCPVTPGLLECGHSPSRTCWNPTLGKHRMTRKSWHSSLWPYRRPDLDLAWFGVLPPFFSLYLRFFSSGGPVGLTPEWGVFPCRVDSQLSFVWTTVCTHSWYPLFISSSRFVCMWEMKNGLKPIQFYSQREYVRCFLVASRGTLSIFLFDLWSRISRF